MEKLIIKEICRIMDVNETEIKDLHRFTAGMSNYTYNFKINGTGYVIRVIGDGADKYVDYYNELNAILLLSANNLTSELIYFDPETGTKIAKEIVGNTYNFETNKDSKPLITALKQMHAIKNDSIKEYGLITRLNEYENFVTSNIAKEYYDLKNWWLDQYEAKYSNEPLVLCHNDLQDANIIVNDKKVNFIDFEYCAYNDIYYDFATFEENSYYVFEQYYNRPISKEERRHINFFKIYQSLQWFLVATYKDSIGFSEQTGHNFLEISKYFITRAEEIKNNF